MKNTVWTDATLARLRVLWIAGHSARAIAIAMGLNKSTVARKALAIGLPARTPGILRTPRAAVSVAPHVHVAPPAPSLPGGCRWPTNPEGQPWTECGAPRRAPNGPYCDAHAERAYVKTSPWKTP